MAVDLGEEKPSQPTNFVAPKFSYGKQLRSFEINWYRNRSWLEYSITKNACYCFPCRKFLHPNEKDLTYTAIGFKNWKTALEMGKGLDKHSHSVSHLQAMSMWSEFTSRESSNREIDHLVHEDQLQRNRYYMSTIIDITKFLAINELSFRGSQEKCGTLYSGMFLQMMQYTLKRDIKLNEIAKNVPKNAKYTRAEFQNELIEILASIVRRNTLEKIQTSSAGFVNLECDETRDKTGVELPIIIRFINENDLIEEKLLGIYELEQLDAQCITDKLLSFLNDVNLSNLIAQCYDGASVMSGKSGGVQAILQERLHRSMPCIHCFNHRLHLIEMHVCDNLDYVRQYFYTCRLVNKFLSKFKVMMVFKNFGGSAPPKLLEHRWSGHHFVAKLLVEKYDIIAKTFDHFVSIDLSNAELTITATGLLTTIRRRKFRFVGLVMKEILSIIKPAEKALQSSSYSLFSGFQIVTSTIRELEKMRLDEGWNEIMDVIPEHEETQERAP